MKRATVVLIASKKVLALVLSAPVFGDASSEAVLAGGDESEAARLFWATVAARVCKESTAGNATAQADLAVLQAATLTSAARRAKLHEKRMSAGVLYTLYAINLTVQVTTTQWYVVMTYLFLLNCALYATHRGCRLCSKTSNAQSE